MKKIWLLSIIFCFFGSALNALDIYRFPDIYAPEQENIQFKLNGFSFYKYGLNKRNSYLFYHATSFYKPQLRLKYNGFKFYSALNMYTLSYSRPYLYYSFAQPQVRLDYDISGKNKKYSLSAGEFGPVTLGNGLIYNNFYSGGFALKINSSAVTAEAKVLGTGLAVYDDVLYLKFASKYAFADILYNPIYFSEAKSFSDVFASAGLQYRKIGLSVSTNREMKYAAKLNAQKTVSIKNAMMRFNFSYAHISPQFYKVFLAALNDSEIYSGVYSHGLYQNFCFPEALWRSQFDPGSFLDFREKDIFSILLDASVKIRRITPFIKTDILSINNSLSTLYAVGIKTELNKKLKLYVFASNKSYNYPVYPMQPLYKSNVHYAGFLLKYKFDYSKNSRF